MNRRESIATVTAAIFLLPLILGRRRRRARGTASRRPLNSKSEFVPSGVVVVGVGVVGVGVVGVGINRRDKAGANQRRPEMKGRV